MHKNQQHETNSPLSNACINDGCSMEAGHEPNTDVFFLKGLIDSDAREILENISVRVQSPIVRVDFSGVKRINSMGIALLLRCFRQICEQRHADIILTGVNEVQAMLFRITGILLLAAIKHTNPAEQSSQAQRI